MGIETPNMTPEKDAYEYALSIKEAFKKRFSELYPNEPELQTSEIDKMISNHLLGKTEELENSSLEEYLRISWDSDSLPKIVENLLHDINQSGSFDELLKKTHGLRDNTADKSSN